MRRLFLLFICLIGVVSLFGQSLTCTDRIWGLTKIWKDVSVNFYDAHYLSSIKWDSLYNVYIPKVMAVKSDRDYYFLLQSFIAQTNDGHTEFSLMNFLKKDRQTDVLPIGTNWIKDTLYVTYAAQDWLNEVPLGSRIISINGLSSEKYFEQHIYPYVSAKTLQDKRKKSSFLFGIGLLEDTISISFITPKRIWRHKSVIYDGFKFRYKNSDFVSIQKQMVHKNSCYEHKVAVDGNNASYSYLRVDDFSRNFRVLKFMDNAKNGLMQSDYVILDLRNNPGGSELTADSLLMYFVNGDTLNTYKSITRSHNSFYAAMGYSYEKYRDYYQNLHEEMMCEEEFVFSPPYRVEKPLYILVGEFTYSAAEDFLISLKLNFPNRAVLVGSATGGSTGAPMVCPLFNGLYYRICTRFPLTPIFQNGLQPDCTYEPTIDELLNRKDCIFKHIEYLYNISVNN